MSYLMHQYYENNFDSDNEDTIMADEESLKSHSEEDTDDASETEFRNQNHNVPATNENNHELKELMYQHKRENLNKQLEELKQLTNPDFVKRIKKLTNQYKDRLQLNISHRDYLKECVERDYILEKKAALKEYEEKKADLKDNIMTDFEERRKLIENERYSLELTSDSTEIKPTVTRKLRRRPNEPVPVVEKRRKPTTGQLLVYMLDEKDIDCDLKAINRALQNGISTYSNHQHSVMLPESINTYVETRIEDGKLLYERRWFHRGQQVFVEGKDVPKYPATITAIGNESVWVKKTNDQKVKIMVSHLAKGKTTIKRRAN